MKIIKKVVTCVKEFLRNNPMKNCAFYKEKGCSHVDGLLCDYPTCEINKEYEFYKELCDYVDALEEGRAIYNKANYKKYLELREKYEK